MTRLLAGIFVGGGARRMRGLPKGLLTAPDGVPIVERWTRMLRARGAEIVLVGANDAYTHLGLECLRDEPPGIGPLGGLVALLRRAGDARAVAVACDMPHVSDALLDKLIAAPAEAPIVAPWHEGRWEPLFARYDAARALPMALGRVGARSYVLQALLDEARAAELRLLPDERRQLRDWDSPEDLLTES